MENTTETTVLEELAEIQAELDAMTPLAPATMSSKTNEEHHAWMAQARHINELMRKAETIALRTLPTSVAIALFKANGRAYRLFDRPAESEEKNTNA